MYMRRHKHLALLQAILDMIRQHGHPVHLYKVQAHTGLVGNEMADEAAKAATNRTADTQTCDVTATTPLHKLYVLAYVPCY